MAGTILGVSYRTILTLILASAVIVFFAWFAFKLMSDTKTDANYASTASFNRIFVSTPSLVEKYNVSKTSYLNIGDNRKIIYFDKMITQLPGCKKNLPCVCLYDYSPDSSRDDQVVVCKNNIPKLSIKLFMENKYYDITCIGSRMGYCNRVDNFPTDDYGSDGVGDNAGTRSYVAHIIKQDNDVVSIVLE